MIACMESVRAVSSAVSSRECQTVVKGSSKDKLIGRSGTGSSEINDAARENLPVEKTTKTSLNTTCDKCGQSVSIPKIITRGYDQTIALLMKKVEELKADKKFLQAALGNSIKNTSPQNTDATDDDSKELALPRAHHAAYQSFVFAESEIGKCTDREAYEWLQEEGPEEYELPAFDTWKRYVRIGRKHHGTQKNTSRKGRTGRSVIKSNEIESLAEVTSQFDEKAD